MEDIVKAPGIKGMLNSFGKIIKGIEPKETIGFCGLAYTCTPLIDFLVYVARDLCERKYYIPEPSYEGVLELSLGEHRVDSKPIKINSVDILVLMGGIAMPKKWEPEKALKVIELFSHERTTIVGACFQDMFKKAGWTDKVPFDYVENCFLTTDANKLKK